MRWKYRKRKGTLVVKTSEGGECKKTRVETEVDEEIDLEDFEIESSKLVVAKDLSL